MGWCSGTEIFDDMCAALLDTDKKPDARKLLKRLAERLEDMDWDCQSDSAYYDHPVVQDIFEQLHPEWKENE